MSLRLWAYDKAQNITFASDDRNVGSQGETRIAFRLSDFADIAKHTTGKSEHEQIDLSQIGQIGFQIYGNTVYQGKILIDNIALGGVIHSDSLPPRSFVKTSGPHFTVNNQRFRFIGANAEYLPIVPDTTVEDVLDRAQSLGIRVIRTWGFGDGCEDYNQPSCEDWSRYFQPQPGVYNASAFEHFDRIVYEAGKRNIRLIIPLANNWGEYGGIPRYVCWHENIEGDCPGNRMDDELHDTFYTNEDIKEWYRQYVSHFVNHINTFTGISYADDPTIMAWELINEPRAKSDPSGAKLHTWIVEMSSYLATLTPNQLIGTGEEGWYIMPREEADHNNSWQVFDSNYWHYGVNWVDIVDGCEITWGSNGADFLSDHSSDSRVVSWQERSSKDSSGTITSSPTLSAERAAVPDIDFTGIHLYPAPGETNLSKAPYCYYFGLDSLCPSAIETVDIPSTHQAREWIQEHVKTSHDELNKPFILEELNFSTLTKIMPENQSSSNDDLSSPVTSKERARLFSQYLDFAYKMDVDGVMFWNLGYDGFAQQAWSELDKLSAWAPLIDNTLTKGDKRGVKLQYGTESGSTQTEMSLSDPQVDWLLADGSHVMLELDNEGDAQQVLVEVHISSSSSPKVHTYEIKAGSNDKIDLTDLFTASSKEKTQTSSQKSCDKTKPETPEVTKVKVVVQGYKSPGSAYFSFYTIFNNKYVIYPHDPLEDVLHLASSQWQKDISAVPPAVKIDSSVTCGSTIHPKLLHGTLPIKFDFSGSIQHPEGYYYRYFLDGPRNNNVLAFGMADTSRTDQLSLAPTVLGKYEIKIAPEGIGFNESGAEFMLF
ncbi:MAG: cellulase family glycosylhydrolase [Anaerolineales bacterium]